jgi:F0F1-type ATP synthase epsilon subunit
MIDDGQPEVLSKVPKGSLHVKVYSPFQTYYDDSAKSLTAVNKTGPFDVLPEHHKFICLLEPCEVVIITKDGDERRIKISAGILHVRSNKATIMLDV